MSTQEKEPMFSAKNLKTYFTAPLGKGIILLPFRFWVSVLHLL